MDVKVKNGNGALISSFPCTTYNTTITKHSERRRNDAWHNMAWHVMIIIVNRHNDDDTVTDKDNDRTKEGRNPVSIDKVDLAD
jgi:hypothetical protein